MGVETENYEKTAKGFENTDFVVCIWSPGVSSQFLPVGYLKGRYKSESSLMTCVAELHGLVTRMPSSILSDMGTPARARNFQFCCRKGDLSDILHHSQNPRG